MKVFLQWLRNFERGIIIKVPYLSDECQKIKACQQAYSDNI